MEVSEGRSEEGGEGEGRRFDALSARHPLLGWLVETGATEREATWVTLGLKNVLEAVDRDLTGGRHPVDRAAGVERMTQVIEHLIKLLGPEKVSSACFATVERENARFQRYSQQGEREREEVSMARWSD